MTRHITLTSLLILILACNTFNSIANTLAGAADLSYQWVSDSTYLFTYKIYTDCSGGAEPASISLCFNDPCNSSFNFSATLVKSISSGNSLPLSCSHVKTACDSIGSTYVGFREWIYTATATLPGRCNAWKISAYAGNRNNSVNIKAPTSGMLYSEISFNNTGSLSINSSPSSSSLPINYVLLNQVFALPEAISDADNDSIIVDVIDPQTGSDTCSGSVSNVKYASVIPPVSLTNNPFQTYNSFVINHHNGNDTFTASMKGANTLRLKINEYRNGSLIGYTTREVQYEVMTTNYHYVPPMISTNPNPAPYFCFGHPFTYTWSALLPGADLVVTDNHNSQMPGSTVTYVNQHTDSVSGTITWTPSVNDVGFKRFVITVTDSTCPPPGIIAIFPNLLPLNIAGPITAPNDTFICKGDTLSLLAQNGDGKYSWRPLSGSVSNITGCNTCNYYNVFPDTLTTYEISSGNTCGVYYKDTVAVAVLTNVTHPNVNIIVTPDSNLSSSASVTFTATSSNCANILYQWVTNGQDISGANSNSYTASNVIDGDQVYCRLTCGDTCPRPSVSVSNTITMHVGVAIIDSKLNNNSIVLYPNPGKGTFYIKGYVPADVCDVEVLNTLGEKVYSNSILTNNHMLTANITLDVPSGVYLLKVNNSVTRFTVK